MTAQAEQWGKRKFLEKLRKVITFAQHRCRLSGLRGLKSNPAFFTAHERKRKAPKKLKRHQNRHPVGGQRKSLPRIRRRAFGRP